MTGEQKAIKYFALVFASILIIGIFSGIYLGVSAVFGISDVVSSVNIVNNEIDSNVKKLEIDIHSAELIFKTGEDFSVSADEELITVSKKGKTLKIEERNRGPFAVKNAGELLITVPEDIEFDKIEINSGAGVINLKDIYTKELELELGSGSTVLSSVTVTDNIEVNGGIGKITFKDSKLNNLKMDMGVGELALNAALMGDSEINFGMGDAEMVLIGKAEDYRLRIDKGIGKAKLEGKNMKGGTYYGEGSNRVDLDGGVGAVSITFEE